MLAPTALDPSPPLLAPSTPSTVRFGVGIDTSRYGHYACFLREDLQPAAEELTFAESAKGYERFRQRLTLLAARHPAVTFVIRLDAAGQYADNLLLERLRGGGAQKRCACPIHRGDGRGRTFSVNLSENVFRCFDSRCDKQGDVIDLWSAVRPMSLREAALDLVRTFELEPAPAKATEKRHG